jgi:hypothetical protein
VIEPFDFGSITLVFHRHPFNQMSMKNRELRELITGKIGKKRTTLIERALAIPCTPDCKSAQIKSETSMAQSYSGQKTNP